MPAKTAKPARPIAPVAADLTFPAPRPDPDDLTSHIVLNTPAYTDSGQWHQDYWQNDTGRTLEIVGCYVWTGMSAGAFADSHIQVYREADNTQLNILQWDHYAQPVAPSGYMRWFHPYKVVLMPGERLSFGYFFTSFAGPAAAAHRVEIYCRSRP